MPEITMTRVCTQMSPRRRIAELTADTELPIRGGWGYTREDAVIIDRQDRVVSKCRWTPKVIRCWTHMERPK